jgi:hypothetical protein
MRIFILFSLILCISINAPAARPCSDTSQPVNPYKLSRKQFLDTYGKDETSRAIIIYFFKERRVAIWSTVAGTVTSVIGALGLAGIAASHPPHEEIGDLIFPMVMFGIASWGVLLTGFGIYWLFHHSRKRLMRTLNDYSSGKGISPLMQKRINKNNVF